jgi:hypothetical protein
MKGIYCKTQLKLSYWQELSNSAGLNRNSRFGFDSQQSRTKALTGRAPNFQEHVDLA